MILSVTVPNKIINYLTNLSPNIFSNVSLEIFMSSFLRVTEKEILGKYAKKCGRELE